MFSINEQSERLKFQKSHNSMLFCRKTQNSMLFCPKTQNSMLFCPKHITACCYVKKNNRCFFFFLANLVFTSRKIEEKDWMRVLSVAMLC